MFAYLIVQDARLTPVPQNRFQFFCATPTGALYVYGIEEVMDMRTTITIEGMSCSHCEMRVKRALEEIAGVRSARVSHETKSAIVETDDDVDAALLERAVTGAGYTVTGTS